MLGPSPLNEINCKVHSAKDLRTRIEKSGVMFFRNAPCGAAIALPFIRTEPSGSQGRQFDQSDDAHVIQSLQFTGHELQSQFPEHWPQRRSQLMDSPRNT
jgi:hypothetical protein